MRQKRCYKEPMSASGAGGSDVACWCVSHCSALHSAPVNELCNYQQAVRYDRTEIWEYNVRCTGVRYLCQAAGRLAMQMWTLFLQHRMLGGFKRLMCHVVPVCSAGLTWQWDDTVEPKQETHGAVTSRLRNGKWVGKIFCRCHRVVALAQNTHTGQDSYCGWVLPDGLVQFVAELVMGHFFKTQPNPKFLDPTQPIIDTRYGILGYTENFIQQLLQIKISK